MEDKIYRTVPVTERLPEKSGVYIIETDKGLVRTCMFVDGDFRSTVVGGDVNVKKDVVYWLEEIELPTDTYIENYLLSQWAEKRTAVKTGINFILKYLKGTVK